MLDNYPKITPDFLSLYKRIHRVYGKKITRITLITACACTVQTYDILAKEEKKGRLYSDWL